MSALREEWRGRAGVVQEREGLLVLTGMRHASWFERSARQGDGAGDAGEVVEVVREMIGEERLPAAPCWIWSIMRSVFARSAEKRDIVVFLLIVISLTVCYAPTLRGMAHQWWTDEDMGHGFLVPVAALWIAWRERKRWHSFAIEPDARGFLILCAAAILHLAGALGAGLFASSVAFLVSIAGMIVCIGGFRLLRALTFPLLLMLFMLPKLAIVYNQATLPLQLLASKMAARMLTMSGAGVIREGNILDVGGHRVAVEEACSGIRYLLPLGFLAVVLAYVTDPRPAMRVALLLAAVPLAIIANATRVALSAWIPALDSGTPHQLSGVVIFALSLAVILLLLRCLQMLRTLAHG